MHEHFNNELDDLGQYFRTEEAQTMEFPHIFALVTIRRIVGRPLTSAEYEEIRSVLGCFD